MAPGDRFHKSGSAKSRCRLHSFSGLGIVFNICRAFYAWWGPDCSPRAVVLKFGSRATDVCEPCQMGNQAALSRKVMCREEAWRSRRSGTGSGSCHTQNDGFIIVCSCFLLFSAALFSTNTLCEYSLLTSVPVFLFPHFPRLNTLPSYQDTSDNLIPSGRS